MPPNHAALSTNNIYLIIAFHAVKIYVCNVHCMARMLAIKLKLLKRQEQN